MTTANRDNEIARRILKAAVALFARKGYEATPTREIVEAAGVTKPMLYYYFASKEGLCRAALRFHVEQFHQRLRRVLGAKSKAHELLVEFVWAHLDFCQNHKDFARLFYALYFGPDDQSADLDLQEHAQAGHELLVEAVEKATRAGLVRTGAQEALAMAIHGMINIWVIAALKKDIKLSRPLAKQIVADLFDGFGRALRTPEMKS